MRKVIIIPDSFKGTMSSAEFCEIAREAIHGRCGNVSVVSVPVADGGEGSVDAFISAAGGERVWVDAKGPCFEDMRCFYGLIDRGATAVIEMASCAGFSLVGDNPNPGKTTTFGVGQLMVDAANRGCKKIIMGLGGSATNDFGAGAASAAGIVFTDRDGREFIPVGETLSRIARIDRANIMPGLKDIEIVTMCDIDNPLYGRDGAAFVFGPQKGAGSGMVEFLDGQLRAVSEVVKRELGVDPSAMPGAGAAGGMGGGMAAFFNSSLRPGIEIVLDAAGFDALLDGADMVITGEGRIDSQSLRGKAVIGIARRAKRFGVPVIVIAGDIEDGAEKAYDEGVSALFSINRKAVPLEEAKMRSKTNLRHTVDNLMRFMNCVSSA
jgi:glycerate kinase